MTLNRLSVRDMKARIISRFRNAGLDAPGLEARRIIEAVTGFSGADLILKEDESLEDHVAQRLEAYVARRLAGEPLDHVLGCRDFYGRQFTVTQDVLSPRPETELLVERALAILAPLSDPSVLDLGTGSGAIIITLAAESADGAFVATDVSEAALSVACENAQRLGVGDRIHFRQGSWLEPVSGQFDLIVSNPPYITDAAMGELATEVKQYDPHRALRGGEDGLTAYREIVADAADYLKPGAYVLFEIGYDQGVSVPGMLSEAGFEGITVLKDLSGHDRIVEARLAGKNKCFEAEKRLGQAI